MRYTNTILLFSKIATVIYFLALIINLIFPVLNSSTLNLNVFTIIIAILWTVAILSCHGFIKKVAETVDDKVIYDTIIPIFPATLIRLIEFGWYFLRHRSEFRIGVFIFDVVFDVMLVAFLLLDKSHYYFEATESEELDVKC